jgi:hypothetical protein
MTETKQITNIKTEKDIEYLQITTKTVVKMQNTIITKDEKVSI